jgi:hypothetical protein
MNEKCGKVFVSGEKGIVVNQTNDYPLPIARIDMFLNHVQSGG